MWRNFLNKYYDGSNPLSPIDQLRLYLKTEFEDRIKKMFDHSLVSVRQKNKKKADLGQIAMISFGFNNNFIIKQLQERAEYIKSEQWADLNKINKSMA